MTAPNLQAAPAEWLQPILYQDDDLVVVNKPSGLAVHRGMTQDKVVAMTVLRDQLGQYVYPIHRLDRGASGALLFALSSQMAAQLNALFEQSQLTKHYLLLCRGIPADEGFIDHPVPRSEGGERVAAQTSYRRLQTIERYSLCEAQPHTGRFHQLRRHLKHLGHPLIGDVNYGQGSLNREFRQRFALHRLALHAARLQFIHPRTQEPLCITAPLPADLAQPLLQMGFALPQAGS